MKLASFCSNKRMTGRWVVFLSVIYVGGIFIINYYLISGCRLDSVMSVKMVRTHYFKHNIILFYIIEQCLFTVTYTVHVCNQGKQANCNHGNCMTSSVLQLIFTASGSVTTLLDLVRLGQKNEALAIKHFSQILNTLVTQQSEEPRQMISPWAYVCNHKECSESSSSAMKWRRLWSLPSSSETRVCRRAVLVTLMQVLKRGSFLYGMDCFSLILEEDFLLKISIDLSDCSY